MKLREFIAGMIVMLMGVLLFYMILLFGSAMIPYQ